MVKRYPGWKAIREWSIAFGATLRIAGGRRPIRLPPADPPLRARAAELQSHVVWLAQRIGERHVPGRPQALDATAQYIQTQLAAAGYRVEPQVYHVAGHACQNLIVQQPGCQRPEEIVVVGAHYDSVPGSPAANDNASGVAALLNLANEFRGVPHDRTLRLVAFVNEEAPYGLTEQMGSWVYAHACRQRNERITGMLCLETIGCYSDRPGSQRYPPRLGWFFPSRANFIALIANTRSASLVRRVVRDFRTHEDFPCQGVVLPESVRDITRSDHWSFWQHGYPALMVTDTAPFRYPFYHTPQDTPDRIDYERTARVVRGLGHALRQLLRVAS